MSRRYKGTEENEEMEKKPEPTKTESAKKTCKPAAAVEVARIQGPKRPDLVTSSPEGAAQAPIWGELGIQGRRTGHIWVG